MSATLIVVIVVGGTVVLFTPLVIFMVWNSRKVKADESAALARLQTELPARGWSYVPQDDRFTEMYNARHTGRSLVDPLTSPPRATSAHDVITGTHRGRPFIAATFQVRFRGATNPEQCVWVFTPAARPRISVEKTAALQSAVNERIGRDQRTGDQAFDRAFEVTAEDPAFAAAVLVPELTQFLAADTRSYRGWFLETDYVNIIHPMSDHRDPAELVPALDFRCDILDRIPPHVWG